MAHISKSKAPTKTVLPTTQRHVGTKKIAPTRTGNTYSGVPSSRSTNVAGMGVKRKGK